MGLQPAGMHHVSALTAHIVRTHDFYTRVLGLRPLLRTVNQDDPTMYHLFYGDGAGTPGSDITVFDMAGVLPERRGNNSITLTTFRVAGAPSLEYWAARLAEHGVEPGELHERDGRAVLDFADAEGTQLSLVADGGSGEAHPWEESPVPAEHQLRGLGYPLITVPELEPTHRFLADALGLVPSRVYERTDHEVHVYGMADGGVQAQVHVAVRPDWPRARYGAGGVHHVALRVPDAHQLEQWSERLDALRYVNSGLVDRHYFTSLYVREPNHVLFELATDGPGFDVDGPLDASRLALPPFLEPRRAELETRLVPLNHAHPSLDA